MHAITSSEVVLDQILEDEEQGDVAFMVGAYEDAIYAYDAVATAIDRLGAHERQKVAPDAELLDRLVNLRAIVAFKLSLSSLGVSALRLADARKDVQGRDSLDW